MKSVMERDKAKEVFKAANMPWCVDRKDNTEKGIKNHTEEGVKFYSLLYTFSVLSIHFVNAPQNTASSPPPSERGRGSERRIFHTKQQTLKREQRFLTAPRNKKTRRGRWRAQAGATEARERGQSVANLWRRVLARGEVLAAEKEQQHRRGDSAPTAILCQGSSVMPR
ncbi:hypothetical protein SRHO_G00021970 [Serrasalmus rhombeus]